MTTFNSNNDSDRATNGSKDVSISNVPLVGKRDRIRIHKQHSDGSTEATTYDNAYTWTAADIVQEKLEYWLTFAGCRSGLQLATESFQTYAAVRVWRGLTIALTLVNPTLGWAMMATYTAFMLTLASAVVRNNSIAGASIPRLLIIVIASI
jgi:hypothetical protein